MSRAVENVLVIGDPLQQVQEALSQALPTANVTTVASYFDAIAELSGNRFSAVLASAEPIERRPEAAVKTLRQLAGDGRFILFGQPSLEPVARKMLNFGVDDYFVTPATPAELSQIFGSPPLRLATNTPGREDETPPLASAPTSKVSILSGLPLAEIVLDAMVQHPHGGPAAAVKQISGRIGPTMQLYYLKPGAEAPAVPDGWVALTHALRVIGEGSPSAAPSLMLVLARDEEESAARHFLAQLATVIGKVASLEDRHVRLQKLAITDDLTGLYNGRYFRHFLTAIIEKARTMLFPVTLVLFDIDHFKSYNDQFGHTAGDEILRQTASLIKRCVRDHDLVARLGGDEFAVVFWEKEGPRTPRDPARPAVASSRIPQTPKQMFERFQRLLESPEYSILGPTGQGQLTISGAMAVFPYHAQDVNGLIEAADRELMFNAKVSGRNCLRLVGEDPDSTDPTSSI